MEYNITSERKNCYYSDLVKKQTDLYGKINDENNNWQKEVVQLKQKKLVRDILDTYSLMFEKTNLQFKQTETLFKDIKTKLNLLQKASFPAFIRSAGHFENNKVRYYIYLKYTINFQDIDGLVRHHLFECALKKHLQKEFVSLGKL